MAGERDLLAYPAATVIARRRARPWPIIAELVLREQPSRVLDVGCGSGTYLRWARGFAVFTSTGWLRPARCSPLSRDDLIA